MKGTIKKLIRDRAFGFIRAADGQEVFFHRGSVQPTADDFDRLSEGDSVEFEAEQSPKGLRAVNVRPIVK